MKYVHRDVAVFKFNLKDLEDWRDNSSDSLPIKSFISFYEACGITNKIQEIKESENKNDIIPFDNLLCNSFTLSVIKNFIERQWKIYSLDIDSNNHVFWKNDQYMHQKHYAKKLSARIKSCLTLDFMHYCPGTDDDLEDYEIVLRLFDKVDTDEETSEEINNEKELASNIIM